jgi:hypothetical protein
VTSTATRSGLREGDLWFVHVGVRARGLDPIVAKLRTEHALRVASLHPRGMPRGAILFVRRLADPLPGGLPLRRAAVGPALAWEVAFRRTLDHRLQAAARPGSGPVPPSAESVLFDDLSHLLAWFGRDVADRVAQARWWWQPLLGGDASAPALARVWQEEAHAVPAALARLAEQGDAARVVAAMEPGAVIEVFEEVARRFGVAPLARAVLDATARRPSDISTTTIAPVSSPLALSPATADHPVTLPRSAPRAAPVWAPWIGNAVDDAPPPVAALVVLSLLIVRAPARIHDQRFVAALSTMPPGPASTSPRAAMATAPVSRPSSLRAIKPARVGDSVHVEADAPRPAQVRAAAADGPAVARPATIVDADADTVAPAPRRHVSAEEAAVIVATSAPPSIAPSDPTPGLGPEGSWRPFHPRSMHAWGAPVDTRLGGLFYLLNVGLFLELYGDFTQPLAPGLTLPIWDFVELVGRGLLAAPAPPDPVWALLAALANREEGHAGDGFEPPADWTIPPAWRAPLGEAARAQLRPGPWLELVIGYVRLRLAAALAVPPDDVADLVLRHRARVHASPTHVDVVFSLTDLPLPIRFAGLDRDPGWIPSGQRTVAFHFE